MDKKTKENRIAGLSLAGEEKKESRYEQIFALLLTLALYTSLIGVSWAMLEFNAFPWTAIATGAVVALAAHLAPGGKAKRITNCVLASTSVVAVIIWHSTILDGMKLILNQMFTVSEKYQHYAYIRFSTSAGAGNHSLCITAATVFICITSAVMCHFAVKQKKGSVLAIILLMVIAAEIYYGIYPQLWTVILFALIGLGVLYRQHNGRACVSSVALLAVALMVSFTVMITYTGPNTWQTAMTEYLRDRFDEHVEQQVSNSINKQREQVQEKAEHTVLKEHKVSDRPDNTPTGNSYRAEYEKHFEGSQAGLAHERLPWAWILVGIMLLSLLVCDGVRMYRARKSRRIFDSSDYAAAIDGMFRHSVDWLEVCGLKRDNRLFSQYSNQVSRMLSAEYSRKYSGAVELWEEAVYSGHAMGEKERGRMREFLDNTANTVSSHVGALTRLKIKYHYFL